jgi:radical SAM superfamily enzyme YgiQ (UPF0313 family)
MRAAGLIGIIIGFESGNQRVLNFIRKGATVEQNYEAAAVCKELGIRIQANFMLGIPTETNEEMMDTFRMIEKINPEFLGRSIYTPAPGSDLFEYCKKNNLTRIVSHDDYRRDPYRPNKLWGIDYGFIERESRRLDRKRLPFVKMLAGECIWYFTRKNRVTLSLIKRLVKVPFIRAAAHALVRKSSA